MLDEMQIKVQVKILMLPCIRTDYIFIWNQKKISVSLHYTLKLLEKIPHFLEMLFLIKSNIFCLKLLNTGDILLLVCLHDPNFYCNGISALLCLLY